MSVAFVSGSYAESFTANSASAVTKAWGAANGAGNLLVVVLSTFNSSITVTVSDDQNGSYTQAGTYQANGSSIVSIWYLWNCKGGVTPTVTVTPSSSAYVSFALQEYSGVQSASDPLRSVTTGATPGSDTNVLSPLCTASAGDLVIGVYGQGTAVQTSCVANSPFTLRANNLNGSSLEGMGSCDDVSAAGSEQASWTINSGTSGWIAMAASFIAGSSPSGGTVRVPVRGS